VYRESLVVWECTSSCRRQ